ncbi:MAG: holo-ACP synthase [Actinomyces urogenitalis]|uniref:holo-ACP synthase n=1 Tax=Actinomyces urogenitalis TaxID=103621 RepID=UPI00242E5F95|nr:holo-ACP synthase [Actinomyces urogenitalis]MCI7456668.1 holo-ACP synthase [Actinomyces urogenitalis]MDY3678837.1 holo-ACP synthase [Actinomyces urogenitalis]
MIVGIGTDLVDVARFDARLRAVPALAERVLTDREREACAARPDSLAARFAAKEAVLKVLGAALAQTGHEAPSGWSYQDIEVVSAPGTPARLALHGVVAGLAAELGASRWHLSLSHDGGAATAVVLAEG